MDRKERLQKLADDYHCSKYGDYADTYEEFAAAYGLKYEGDEPPEYAQDEAVYEPIPRYVTTAHDETYSMLSTWDNIDDALNGLLAVIGDETLNIPGYLIDLDTGDVLGW